MLVLTGAPLGLELCSVGTASGAICRGYAERFRHLAFEWRLGTVLAEA
jgi:hypothetical protein